MFDLTVEPSNTDNPTILLVFYSMLLAFLLATLLAFTYERTSRDIITQGNFIQAMILGSMVVATIMQAIGDSLGRGLGMMGALALIRFRMPLRGPRNIIFMFAALGSGIACGVSVYNVGIVGTVMFCIVAFLLRFSPYSSATNPVCTLRFVTSNETKLTDKEIEKFIRQYAQTLVFWRVETVGGAAATHEKYEYQYKMALKKNVSEKAFMDAFHSLEGIASIKLAIRHQTEEY